MKITMKRPLLNLLLIVFILIILGIYIYTSYNKSNKNNDLKFDLKEVFFDGELLPSFIALKNNQLFFITLDSNRKVKLPITSINSPSNDNSNIKSFVYSSDRKLFLLTQNGLYLCDNCNLHENNKAIWKPLALTNIGSYLKIGYDIITNLLFILGTDNKIYSYNYSTNQTAVNPAIKLNSISDSVIDFDVSSGYLTYISNQPVSSVSVANSVINSFFEQDPDIPGYTKIPNTDSVQDSSVISVNITNPTNPFSKTINQLANDCTNDPTCQGFNNAGWLKKYINTASPSILNNRTVNLYVKNSDYTVFPNKDSAYNDIATVSDANTFTKTIDQLKSECSANQGCAGFTNSGFLKTLIKPQSEWTTRVIQKNNVNRNTDLYVKNVDYTKHVLLDSNGNDIGNAGTNIATLKSECNKLPNCQGFNTDGWLKNPIKPINDWGNTTNWNRSDLYIKNKIPFVLPSILPTSSPDISSSSNSTLNSTAKNVIFMIFTSDLNKMTTQSKNNYWKQIPNSSSLSNISQITINQNGISVKANGGWYNYNFNVNNINPENTFNLKDNDAITAFSSNMDIISIVKNNKIFECAAPCANQLNDIGITDQYQFVEPIYYMYPNNQPIRGPINDITTNKNYNFQPIRDKATQIKNKINELETKSALIPSKIANFNAKQIEHRNKLFDMSKQMLNNSMNTYSDSIYIKGIIDETVSSTYLENREKNQNTTPTIAPLPDFDSDTFVNIPSTQNRGELKKTNLYLVNDELAKIDMIKPYRSSTASDIVIRA
jgi:hypothetical protein